MKKVQIDQIDDPLVLSWLLDRALHLLAQPPVGLRLSGLSKAVGLHASSLTRMKLLYVNDQYSPFVHAYALQRVLRYLFETFPTLVVRQSKNGQLHLHLYYRYGGHKLNPNACVEGQTKIFERKTPKAGSTRWFLEQIEAEARANPYSL